MAISKPKGKAKKPPKVDGLGPDDLKKIRTALRRVWSWSHARRLCVNRSLNALGFPVCEKCQQVSPKTYPDHIVPCGEILEAGFIERLFVPSSQLQALCKKCHQQKTNAENRARKALEAK